MTHILIVAHAPLASALGQLARHTFPDCAAGLSVIDVAADESPATIEARVRQLVAHRAALILTDVFGATPCNAALQVADGVQVRVVCGVNVPMLWRSLCYAGEPLDALVTRAVDGGAQGVMRLAAAPPQNQANTMNKPQGPDGQEPHHDQQ
jgi:mannose PTS system EIIA component